MIKTALTAFKGYSAIKQGLLVIALVTALLGAAKSYFFVHDYLVKKEVITEITKQEGVIKDEDEKRVENASVVVSTVPDCLKLSSVYNSDQCAKRQNASTENIPETAIAEETNSEGNGSRDSVVDRLSLSLGSLFQDQAENERMPCITDFETGEVVEGCE